jgi:hypothetical protein
MTIKIEEVNKFKQLGGPCLLCKKMPSGIAYGITPAMAVCATCATEKPEEAEAALEKAEKGPQRKRAHTANDQAV